MSAPDSIRHAYHFREPPTRALDPPGTSDVGIEPPLPFPLDVFPPDVQAYLTASARSARVQESMVALPFLAVIGATIGNQLALDVGNGWLEYPSLWVAVIAATGAGKTPGLAWARLPLDRLQEEAWHATRQRRGRVDVLITTNATFTTLSRDLERGPGLLVVRDELHALIASISQYRRGTSRHAIPWHALWSSEPLAVSRASRADTWVPAPVVGIAGGIQPELWYRFAREQGDGTIQRFIPLVVGVPRGYWSESTAADLSRPDVEGMVDRLRRLRSIRLRDRVVTRTPEAGQVWANWYNDNLDRALSGSYAHFGFIQKLPSRVARTALILHALWRPDDPSVPLTADTMRQATTLGEFYRVEMHRALSFLNIGRRLPAPKPTLGERILRLLAEDPADEGWLTRGRLHELLGKPPRAELSLVLDQLIANGFVDQRRQQVPHAKRPVLSYRLDGKVR